MAKKIELNLSVSSINNALKELKAYSAWVKKKTVQLVERLAMIGVAEATVRFFGAYYEGGNDVSVEAEQIENGWKITANGEAVCFIEFGAGVYYNGPEPYPLPRPSGVSKIGEYGQGKGKQNTWGYYSDNGELVLTHGTPAAMPMYFTSRTMQKEIAKIANEVFRS